MWLENFGLGSLGDGAAIEVAEVGKETLARQRDVVEQEEGGPHDPAVAMLAMWLEDFWLEGKRLAR